jgi:hypothetical protein
MNLDLPNTRRMASLSLPNPSPLPTASNSRSVSQSSSYGGQGSKRLCFRGQRVNVILPSTTPDTSQWIDDILSYVTSIHALDDDEASIQTWSNADSRML